MTEQTDPVANILWKINYKMNGDDGSFNFGFHRAGGTEAAAIAAGNAVAVCLKAMMPTNCEITAGILSKDNSAKDGLFLASAMGVGTYQDPGAPATDSVYDHIETCLDLRFESEDNLPVVRKVAPIPDLVIEAGRLASPITAVVGAVVAAPTAPAGGDTWFQLGTKLMQALMYYGHWIKTGHQPGGNYFFAVWKNCYAVRVGKKKAGVRLLK